MGVQKYGLPRIFSNVCLVFTNLIMAFYSITTIVTFCPVLLHKFLHIDKNRNRVLFIEAYNSTGEFTFDRVTQIKDALSLDDDTEVAFITAFATTKKMLQRYSSIAWDTDIWVAEDETHMTHKNGDKFLGRKL